MRLRTVQNASFLILLAGTTLLFFDMIQDFWLPLFWAAVLATLFFPLQRRFTGWFGGREGFAALATIGVIVVAVISPILALFAAVANEGAAFYDSIRSGEIDIEGQLQAVRDLLPQANQFLDRFGIEIDTLPQRLSETAVNASRALASQAIDVGQNIVRIAALFFVMLYVLFFFLKDGDDLGEAIIKALPLDEDQERRLFGKFAEVSRATIKGTLIIGVIQGGLGGLLFALLGIPAPVLWGFVMAVCSMLPAVGSGLVWTPAAIILIATGDVTKGLILLAAGFLFIGLIDNVLRPILVGRDTKMPDYLILVSTLGGIAAFGLSGFVAGPIVAALFLVIWQMFENDYTGGTSKQDLKAIENAVENPEAAPEPPQGDKVLEPGELPSSVA